jgi:DNA polymerase III subunit epsilon
MDKETFCSMLKGTLVLALDIETTGLGKDTEYIIELGLMELREGVNTHSIDRLFSGGKSGQKALETHGITDEERAGKSSFAQKAGNFKDIIVGVRKADDGEELKTVVIGHNVKKFDLPFLAAACKRAGYPIEPKRQVYVVDTMDLAKKYLSAPDNKLQTLCKVYKFAHGGHRGLGDTKSCLNILTVCMEKAGVKNIMELAEPFNFN